MKRNSVCTDDGIADLVRRLEREGWAYERGRAHGTLRDPAGRFAASVPVTPRGGSRVFANFRSVVRRHCREHGLGEVA